MNVASDLAADRVLEQVSTMPFRLQVAGSADTVAAALAILESNARASIRAISGMVPFSFGGHRLRLRP